MAAKPESLSRDDEDIKIISVLPIESLFINIKFDEKGTGDESTLARSTTKKTLP
jgi:hypothetical protein